MPLFELGAGLLMCALCCIATFSGESLLDDILLQDSCEPVLAPHSCAQFTSQSLTASICLAALFGQADEHLKRQKIGEAEVVYRRVQQSMMESPHSTAALRGAVQFKLAAFLSRAAVSNRAEVVSLLRGAVLSDPAHNEAKLLLAKQLLQLPHFELEALQLLESVDVDPVQDVSHAMDVRMLRGYAADRIGDLARAKANFEAVVQLHHARAAFADSSTPFSFSAAFAFRLALNYVQLCRVHIHLGAPDACLKLLSESRHLFAENNYQMMNIEGLAVGLSQGFTAAQKFYANVWRHRASFPEHASASIEQAMGATLAFLKTGPPRRALRYDNHPHSTSRRQEFSACNIDRRVNISKLDFMNEYVLKNKPVVLTGVFDDWPAVERWTLDGLKNFYGGTVIQAKNTTDVAFSQQFGAIASANMTLISFVDSAIFKGHDANHLYVFGPLPRSISLQEDFSQLTFLFDEKTFSWPLDRRRAKALWYVGGAGSGASFHEHSNAWNALLVGKKRWVIYPPYGHFGPVDMSMADWFDSWQSVLASKNKTAYECTQHAGELMYVPSNHVHGVLNLGRANVGVAVEVGHTKLLIDNLLKDE